MTIIAIGQILCIDGDHFGNLQKIEKAVEYAKIKKAEIIVFPESVIYGWVNPDAHFKAIPIPGDDSDFLCKIAKKHSIFIFIGLDENENNNLFDSAILIDDNGEILLKHQKINVLPGLMSPPYTKGNSINTIKTKFGNIGLLSCADSFQSAILEQIGLKKPDLMLIPYGWAAP
jgi:predicted amidohydrolase